MFASGTIFSVEPPNDATRAPRPRPHREPLDQIREFGKVGCGVHAQNRLHFLQTTDDLGRKLQKRSLGHQRREE